MLLLPTGQLLFSLLESSPTMGVRRCPLDKIHEEDCFILISVILVVAMIFSVILPYLLIVY